MLYLWQIRHIPNRPQTLLRLTIAAAACIAVSVTFFVPMRFVAGQAGDGAAEKTGAESKVSSAKEFLERVRQELPKHQSIKADLSQSVSIGDQQFKIEGEYLSAGTKLKLKYTVVPEQGAKGEMLEVCDGKELWTMLTLYESKESKESKRVTRRNIRQILEAAVAAKKRDVPDSAISVELGMGGLTALLASLDRTMTFDAMKADEADGHSQTIIQGRWKKEIADRFPKDKEGSLPPFIPDLVRLYVNTQTLFPEKLLYLKRIPSKKTFKSLVSLEFRNVEFDVPVDEKTFVFLIGSDDDVVPEDVTKLYLDRLTKTDVSAPAAK